MNTNYLSNDICYLYIFNDNDYNDDMIMIEIIYIKKYKIDLIFT